MPVIATKENKEKKKEGIIKRKKGIQSTHSTPTPPQMVKEGIQCFRL